MLSETLTVYSKYSYNLFIVSNERLIFFRKNGDYLDYDQFFSYYNCIIYKHSQLRPLYRNFKSARSRMIKKFNYGKYYILLRPYFCSDLVNLIIGFI